MWYGTYCRFLEELRARQNETTIIKGIADIVLEYVSHAAIVPKISGIHTLIVVQAESKLDCYIRYCTNQIYQSRELQECL